MTKFLTLMLLAGSTLFASQTSATFEKTFGGKENDVAKAVVKTDNGYLIAGKSNSFAKRRYYDAYLIKIDKNGNKIWSKVYGGEEDDDAQSLTRYGNDFVFIGSTESYGNDSLSYYFTKIDTNGTIDWQKSYYRGERDYYYGNDIIADGEDLVIAGTEKHLSFMSSKIDPLLFKINKEGNIVWRSYYHGKDEDHAYAIINTDDGYLMAGMTETYGHGNFDSYAIKLDKNGKRVWYAAYGGDDDEAANDLIATDDGYLLVGSTDSFDLNYKDVYVVKIDKNGKVIWEKSYGAKYDDEGFAITKSPDGGYVIVGKAETRRNGTDLYLFKIDAKGNQKWSRTYGDEGDDAGYDIITADDGYLIVGEKESVSSRYNDVWVLKVDFDGKF
jgi:hypothetical protein